MWNTGLTRKIQKNLTCKKINISDGCVCISRTVFEPVDKSSMRIQLQLNRVNHLIDIRNKKSEADRIGK